MKKRKPRRRVKRATGDEPPPLTGIILKISHVGRDGIPRTRLELDIAQLLLLQDYRRTPMNLGQWEVSLSRTAT